MLLLSAIDTEPDEIVRDYLETVRRGELRAAHSGGENAEPALETFCHGHGTTTENAFRDALAALDLERLLDRSGLTETEQASLRSWRGTAASHP